MTLLNKDQVPRSLEQQVDALELVKSARQNCYDISLESIIPLLNLEGDEGWKQQAHADARKMTVKLVCMREIDDESMASLLAIPHIRAASLEILNWIYQEISREDLKHSCYYGERKSFSDTHCATWKAFSSIYSSNFTLLPSRVSQSDMIFVSNNILWMLQFESERTILTELQKLRELTNQSQDPGLEDILDSAFLQLHHCRLTSEMLDGLHLQQYLPAIIWKAIDDFDHVQSSSMVKRVNRTFQDAMRCVYRDKGYVNILLTFPIPLEEWLTNISCFRKLLRLEQRYGPQSLLGLLSATPEFKAKAAETLKGDWWEEDFTLWPESYGDKLARFWGNVALLRDLHNATKLRLVKIAKRWMAGILEYSNEVLCSCTCSDSDECCSCRVNQERISGKSWREITRTVTIISHLDPNTLVIPNLECWQQRLVTSRCSTCRAEAWVFCSQAWMGRALAYCQMEMHGGAMSFVDFAQQPFHAILAEYEKLTSYDAMGGAIWKMRREMRFANTTECLPNFFKDDSRALVVFMKALSKDYQGAMDSLHQVAQRWSDLEKKDDFCQFRLCSDRAVLFRLSGEFSKAIHNFSLSLERWENMTSQRWYIKSDPRIHNLFKYCVLQHREYAKYLVGDPEGSQLDMKSAGDLRSSKQILEPISWDCLSDWPGGFGSLGSDEAGLKYSLLQFPVDKHLLLS